jgi:hypothetical protein
MIRREEQARLMGKGRNECKGEKSDTFRPRMIRGKKKARIMGKCLEK